MEKIVRYIFSLNSSFVFYIVEDTSKEEFTPEGHHDILVAAIGRLEHPGRMRCVGSGVGIRQFFSSPSRQSLCRHNVDYEERLTEEIIRKVTGKVIRQFESYGIRPHLDPPAELEPFVPPIGKINNLFSISYELNK